MVDIKTKLTIFAGLVLGTSTAPAWPVGAGLQCLQCRLQCCMILHDLNTTQSLVCSLSGFVVVIFTSNKLSRCGVEKAFDLLGQDRDPTPHSLRSAVI